MIASSRWWSGSTCRVDLVNHAGSQNLSIDNPAGFWRRLAARLIDLFLILVMVGLAASYFDQQVQPRPDIPDFSADEFSLSDAFWLNEPVGLWGLGKVPITVIALVESIYQAIAICVWSTTVGKRILGIYVQRLDGARVGVLRSVVRPFAFWLMFIIPLVALIGAVILAFRPDKRGLHDLLCEVEAVVKRPAFLR